MSQSTISLKLAQTRSQELHIDSTSLTLDLSQAATAATYPVVAEHILSTTNSTVVLDYLGEEISSVTIDGENTDFEFDGSTLTVANAPTDTAFTLSVAGVSRFSRTGQGLHRFTDPSDEETYLYSHLEPSDARRIFPCFDQPDLKTTYSVTMVVPSGWQALTNQPEVDRAETDGGNVKVVFAPTPLLSSYLTSFAAGPYVGVQDSWTSSAGQVVDLGVWTRKSMAQYVDAEIMEITKQGLSFFDEAYDFPYPWGKYDSIFVPEYNLGAMENPGLVTFTEKYIFRSPAARNQHAARTNTILHEMSHMWFGDLVTPQWWDDLWLKESFAEFMGADSSVSATEYKEAWVNFAGNRKNWAYVQDQLPTTHPIKADIPDVDAARQNFDGITYAKGAAVLKQLVHFVGRENFYAAAREYFKAHAFSSATFDDLLAALKNHTDQDLDQWAKRWLRTTGPDLLQPVMEIEDDKLVSLSIKHVADAVTRPHRIDVSLFRTTSTGSLEKFHSLDVTIPADSADGLHVIEEAAGLDAPALVVLNDNDHTYAKVSFDDVSLATIRGNLSQIPDEITRAVVWTSLWNMTRDAKLDAADYVRLVLAHGAAESNSTLLTQVFANALFAARNYVPADQADKVQAQLADGIWYLLADTDLAVPGSDTQLVLTRAAIAALASTPDSDAGSRLRQILDGRVEGLELSPDLRWQIISALVARGETSQIEVEAEQQLDNTLTGAVAFLGASHAWPVAEAKEAIFAQVQEPGKYSNDEVDALLDAFNAPRSEELRKPFREPYFEALKSMWDNHPIEIANRLVRGLYPSAPQTIQLTDEVLSQDIPGALRRVLLECQDQLRRELLCRGEI